MVGNEQVEVVDVHGEVERIVPRSQMRAENLRHRCVYVAVLTQLEELPLVVHQRASWKDAYPGFWDLAFGGVCDVGEQWETAAHRELEEEAGLTNVELVDLGPVDYSDVHTMVYGRAFVALCEHELLVQNLSNRDGEVVAFASVPLVGLASWVEATRVCPDSATVVAPALLRVMKK